MIILDPRDGSGDLLPLLPRDAELGRIENAEGQGIGDVMSDGWGPAGPIMWGMEIKKLSEALDSLQSGRLPAGQLVRMHEHFAYVFLLIEADMRADPASGNLQKRVRKQHSRTGKWQEYWVDVLYGARERVLAVDFLEWLISLHVTGGARLLFSSSRETTAAWIVAVWKCLGKPWDKHKSLKVFDDSHPPRFVIPSRAACVARDLARGVGWEKAMAAGEYFGSPQAVTNATIPEWLNVPGIGPELAAKLFSGAREAHRTVVKHGTSFGGGVAAAPTAPTAAAKGGSNAPHGNVLPAPRRHPAPRRKSNRGPLHRPDGSGHRRGTGKW